MMHTTVEARSAKLIKRVSVILIVLSALALLYTVVFEATGSIVRISVNTALLVIAYVLCLKNKLLPAKLIICLSPAFFSMVLPVLSADIKTQYMYWYPIAAIGFSILPYLFLDMEKERIAFWTVTIFHVLLAIYIPFFFHTGKFSSVQTREALTTASFRAAYTIIYLLVNLCVYALVNINKFYELQISALNNSLEKIVVQRTSELMERNAQLSQYAYMNSHKVRGPLARILGLVGLLKEDVSEADKLEILDKLQQAAQELDVVVSDMNRKLNE